MPAALKETPVTGVHQYPLKTNASMRRRVLRVMEQYNLSYNGALNLLLAEALDARSVPNE
jgi:hypothetical protein